MFDLVRLCFATVLGSVVATAVSLGWLGAAFPRSVYPIEMVVCLVLAGAGRSAMRVYRETIRGTIRQSPGRKNILIYGAGAAGEMLAREIRVNPNVAYHIVGFLDDDPDKAGARVLGGYSVLGPGREAARIVANYRRRGNPIDEIVIAMPSAPGHNMREAAANCRAAGVVSKTIPGLGELLVKTGAHAPDSRYLRHRPAGTPARNPG